jgi:hypothetical protein
MEVGSMHIDDPIDMIDSERYPLADRGSSPARAVIDAQRRALAERGVAILPGFVKPDVIGRMADEALALQARAHLEDVWGTPYLEMADESYPVGHPRRTAGRSLTWVVAYDVIPRRALVRRLYEWDPLMDFIGEILQRRPLYRMADPLGALNVAIMSEEHTQGWHYDNADFVVSLAIQSSRGGGRFECASFIRTGEDENYDAVAKVLAGSAGDRVEVLPMTPGTLMLFAGRNSVHRVSPVEGEVPRLVALFAYDTRPDANSSEIFKYIRYGRAAPIATDA